MSNKFSVSKYAAIASAVALACGAGAAVAGTVGALAVAKSGTAANASAPSTADITFGADVSVLLEGSYAVNDLIVLTLAGGSFRTGTDAATPSMTCSKTVGAANSTLVLGLVSKTSSAITYRVQGGTGLELTGFSCVQGQAGMSVTRNSITSGTAGVTLSTASYINGTTTAFDTQTTARQMHQAVAQFSATLSGTGFSGTVDIATSRLAWLGATAATPTLTRTMSLVLSGETTGVTLDGALFAGVSNVTAQASIYGATSTPMFAWLDDDSNGCTADDLTTGPGSASVSTGGSLSISSNCATLTWSFPAAVGATTGSSARTVTLTLAKTTSSTGLAIQTGAFSVAPSFVVTNASSATQSITAFGAGSFTLNGAAINIPYMPYGTSGTSAITQAYYITNTSTTAGVVTGTARNQAGVACNMGTVGTAAAQSVTNLSTGINNAIAACYATAGVFPEGTRVYIDLSANTEIASTLVNAAYNVGGSSRVQVTNDSNQFRTR